MKLGNPSFNMFERVELILSDANHEDIGVLVQNLAIDTLLLVPTRVPYLEA